MKIDFNAAGKPLTLKVLVNAPKGALIGIDVMDAERPLTCYSSTDGTMLKGKQTFFIPLPLSPVKGYISIYRIGKDGKKSNTGFRVIKTERKPLVTNFNLFDTSNPDILDFAKFAEQFSLRASTLSAGAMKEDDSGGSFYKSDDGKFTIQYVDEIIDWCPTIEKDGKEVNNPNYGKPVKTSMRINSATGLIQCSKKYMLTYSIPERMAILLHEFSHYYLNYEQKNEFEADMNAILIYFGLGFSKREGGTSFWKVFCRTPSNLNVERMNQLINLLDRVDQYQFKRAA